LDGDGGQAMTMKNLFLKAKTLRDTRGQDLIEYALMAGFVSTAAGAFLPGIGRTADHLMDLVRNVLRLAANQHG
jgi:pilus assembly protein Flp/PilA